MNSYKFNKIRDARCLAIWEIVDQTGTPKLFMVADEATTGLYPSMEDVLNTDTFISRDYYATLKTWRETLVKKIFAEVSDRNICRTSERIEMCKLDVIKLLEELGV